jgi:hypothetical protein
MGDFPICSRDREQRQLGADARNTITRSFVPISCNRLPNALLRIQVETPNCPISRQFILVPQLHCADALG